VSLPILIDCDDVLSDFLGAVCALARRHDRPDVTIASLVPCWDLAKATGWQGVTQAITDAVRDREFCYRMPELPGAIRWLREIEETFGADRVFVCTSPWNGPWAGQRHDWLAKRGVPVARQIHTSRKDLIPGYLVDDAEKHIKRRPMGFLLDSPQNVDVRARYEHGNHAAASVWLAECVI
jgi:hypothetical protein